MGAVFSVEIRGKGGALAVEAADTQGKGRCLWPRGVRKHGAKDGAERVHKGSTKASDTHAAHTRGTGSAFRRQRAHTWGIGAAGCAFAWHPIVGP